MNSLTSSLELTNSRPNSSTALRGGNLSSADDPTAASHPFLQTQVLRSSSSSSYSNSRHRTWAISLFSITTLLLFSDQNLMAPNLTEIAAEFGFDDEERDRKLGGEIALAFFLLGAPASMVIGYLADSSDRSVVFAWTVFIGEGACFLTYWVTTYQQLYICRAVTGFSVGGAVPLIYSVLGDFFGASDRHFVSALVSFGTGAGIAVGQSVAGILGPLYGWRLPFLVVSIPALITAALVLFTVPDPERGAMEPSALRSRVSTSLDIGSSSRSSSSAGGDEGVEGGEGVDLVTILHHHPKEQDYHDLSSPHDSPEPGGRTPLSKGDSSSSIRRPRGKTGNTRIVAAADYFERLCDERYGGIFGPEVHKFLRTMVKLLSTPTVFLAIVQGAPGCITWGIINVFLNDFLSENRGFSVLMATTTLMFFSLGHGIGLFLLGGGLGQRLYRCNRKYPAILAGSAAIVACVPLWILFNWVDAATPYWKTASVALLAGFGCGPTGPIIKATLTNVTHPRERGQAFALFNLFDDFGKGLGPFFVALLISGMGGRSEAFNLGIWGWAICGLANLAVFFFVEADEDNMQADLIVSSNTRDLSG